MRLVPPFNNGLLSNELVLSVRDGPGRAGILPLVSRRCCDSKELEINLGYNNFFCGPRPTTRINQISSFRASARASSFFPIVVLDSMHLHLPGCHPHPSSMRSSLILSFVQIFFESNHFMRIWRLKSRMYIWEFFVIENYLRKHIFKNRYSFRVLINF